METGAYEYRENAPEEEKKRWKERYEKLSEPVERRQMVYEIRKAARQFAMLYFHFCKTLYDTFGLERTKELVRQTKMCIRDSACRGAFLFQTFFDAAGRLCQPYAAAAVGLFVPQRLACLLYTSGRRWQEPILCW